MGMSHLVSAKWWPKLKDLDLSSNEDTWSIAACAVLSDNPGSSLERLNLHENRIGPACSVELVKGNWPMLRYLDVSSSNLDVVAVSILHLGKWPLLECLELADNAFSEGVMHLLSLGNQAGLIVGTNTIPHPTVISKGHWPQLRTVHFSDPMDVSVSCTGEDS